MERTGASCCVLGGQSLVAAVWLLLPRACVCEADDGLSSHTGFPRQTDLTAASSASSASNRRTGEREQASRRTGEPARRQTEEDRECQEFILFLSDSTYPVSSKSK